MPNADMNRLISHAKVRLPGSLDSAINLELFAVMNEFFQQSNIWTEDIDFSVTPTTENLALNPEAVTYGVTPSEGTVTRLIGVLDDQGYPVPASMPVLGEIVLARAPSSAATYKARVALTVTDPVTNDGYPVFPDWVLNKYGNEILDGVLGRMMSQIAKPYTSQNGAVFHLRSFRQGVSQAKIEATRQNLYRGQSWRFPQTFARRRTR